MNPHDNSVNRGQFYPLHPQPRNVSEQPSTAYPNTPMRIYHPVYTGVTPGYLPPEMYPPPTYVSHLKSIASHILASDARIRARRGKKSLADHWSQAMITQPVVRAVADTLKRLGGIYYREPQPTTFPGTRSKSLKQAYVGVGRNRTLKQHHPLGQEHLFRENHTHHSQDTPTRQTYSSRLDRAFFGEDHPLFRQDSSSKDDHAFGQNLSLKPSSSFKQNQGHLRVQDHSHKRSSFISDTSRKSVRDFFDDDEEHINVVDVDEDHHFPHEPRSSFSELMPLLSPTRVEYESSLTPPLSDTETDKDNDQNASTSTKHLQMDAKRPLTHDQSWNKPIDQTTKGLNQKDVALELGAQSLSIEKSVNDRQYGELSSRPQSDQPQIEEDSQTEERLKVGSQRMLSQEKVVPQRSLQTEPQVEVQSGPTSVHGALRSRCDSRSQDKLWVPTTTLCSITPLETNFSYSSGISTAAGSNVNRTFFRRTSTEATQVLEGTSQQFLQATLSADNSNACSYPRHQPEPKQASAPPSYTSVHFQAGNIPLTLTYEVPQTATTSTTLVAWSESQLHKHPSESYVSGNRAALAYEHASSSLTTGAFQTQQTTPSYGRASLINDTMPQTTSTTRIWNWQKNQQFYEQAAHASRNSKTKFEKGTILPRSSAVLSAFDALHARTAIGAQGLNANGDLFASKFHSSTSSAEVPSEQDYPSDLSHKKSILKRRFASPQLEVPQKQTKLTTEPPVFVTIGDRGTRVRRDFYNLILWGDCVRCTKLLMQFIFDFRSMATLTVDGPDCLDPDIVHDIVAHVALKCDTAEQQVLDVMKHICSVAKQCYEESNCT